MSKYCLKYKSLFLRLGFSISNNIYPPRRLFCNKHDNACFISIIYYIVIAHFCERRKYVYIYYFFYHQNAQKVDKKYRLNFRLSSYYRNTVFLRKIYTPSQSRRLVYFPYLICNADTKISLTEKMSPTWVPHEPHKKQSYILV